MLALRWQLLLEGRSVDPVCRLHAKGFAPLRGLHRSTHIASDLASQALASQAKTAARARIASILHSSILIEAQRPTPKSRNTKKNTAFTRTNFTRIFPFFSVTRVRNPTKIVQKTCSDELLYFGWIYSGGFSSSELKCTPDTSRRRPTSQDFRRGRFWHFSCDFRSSKGVFALLVIGGVQFESIAHRNCVARFGPLRFLPSERHVPAFMNF